MKLKVGEGKGQISAAAPEAPMLPLAFRTAVTADLRSSDGCFRKIWTLDQVLVQTEKKFLAKQ